jgi:hypothetical protein
VKAALPAIVVLTVAVGLGIYVGILYLRRVRKPVLIGLHLLLGVAGIEAMVMMLRGAPDGAVAPAGSFGIAAAVLLATAMVSGLAAPLLAKHSRQGGNAVLATHAAVGVLGFLLVLAWASQL